MISMQGVFLLFVFMAAGTPVLDDPDQLFDQANEFYADQEYDLAIDGYHRILDQGFYHAGLFYNLGNAHFKQHNLANAILNYEKALLLQPTDPEIRDNLTFVRARVLDQVQWQEPATPIRFLLKLIHLSSPNVDFVLLSLSWWAFQTALFLSFRSVHWIRERTVRRVLFTSGSLTLFCVILFAADLSLAGRSNEGIVLHEEVDVRSGPGIDETPLFSLHEGTKIRVRNRTEKWLQVFLPDGLNGWVESSAIGEVRLD